MNKTDKVICKDCKWYIGYGFGFSFEDLVCKPKGEENGSFDPIVGYVYNTYHVCYVKNQNGHCEDYKEKLFKKLKRKICNLFRK
jgi:hypothetical protein